MRVFELAKKLDIESKALVKALQDNGISATNHMSAIEASDVERITRKLQGTKTDTKKSGPAGIKQESREKGKSGAAAIKKKVEEEEKPAEKKPRMLLRKKAKADEPVSELPVSAPEATPLSSHLQMVLSNEPLAEPHVAPPSPVIPPAESISRTGAEVLRSKVGEPAYAGKGSELAPPLTEAVKTEEKGKKKGAEEAAKEALKASKDRFKKGTKKTKWGTDAVLTQVPSETREWQDFKPIHKRDDRRGARKALHAAPAGETTKPRKKVIRLMEGMTVKELAELLGVKGGVLIGKLMEMGSPASLNQTVNLDAASLISESYGIKAEVVQDRTEADIFQKEDVTDTAETLKPRPPVVTIMGHVDHGKTSLLDAIRETRVTESEAGGITQHIGAYVVNVGEKKICFLDTPGHEAFTAMRSRGAKVTDIVVLVVAADDGVMPQTIEAINHAKAAGVPIIVAINKIDKPEANVDKIKNSLSEFQLISEAWGGETIFVEVSAKKKTGLDTLLEMILLQADLLELKANYEKPGKGNIIEAKLDRGRGPVATLLISEGKVKIGDYFVTGIYTGKVRALINDRGESVKESGPSTPVEVIGLDGVPQAGDSFVILKDEKAAREIAATRALKQRVSEMGQARKITLTDLFSQIKEGEVKELNLIIKGDVQGSVEALKESLMKLTRPEVKVVAIHIGVGGITESDVLLASASNAIIIGFNVTPETKASQLAEREKVDIRFYNIIYNAVSDVQAAMEGLLAPTLKERILGRAEVRQTFNVPKMGTVAGCYVLDGTISRTAAGVRLIRDSVVICDGKISSLRRFKDDVKEVQTGYECGIGIENYNDIKLKDIIEAYAIDKIAGKLSTLEARPRTEEKEPA